MGTWGPGNFDGDASSGLRDTFVRKLVHRIGRLFRSKKLDIFKAEEELMPCLAILAAVCDRCEGIPPRPHIVSQWKRQYLGMFDTEMAKIARAEFIPQRRKVVKATFDRLQKLSGKRHGDFTDDELPETGAVFLCPLKDGRYGACRVLQRVAMDDDPYYAQTLLLVGASPWIGSGQPDLDNPELRRILHTDHHNQKGVLALGWLSEPPPESFKHLGHLPPSKKEQKLGSRAFLRDWTVLPRQVLLQWRWDHDRDALLADEAANEPT